MIYNMGTIEGLLFLESYVRYWEDRKNTNEADGYLRDLFQDSDYEQA